MPTFHFWPQWGVQMEYNLGVSRATPVPLRAPMSMARVTVAEKEVVEPKNTFGEEEAPMVKICGSGDTCEKTCPVMSAGRICPDIPAFLEELRCLNSESSATSPQTVPQPA